MGQYLNGLLTDMQSEYRVMVLGELSGGLELREGTEQDRTPGDVF